MIANTENPKIVDTPLTPIFMKGSRACRRPSSLSRRPILPLYIGTTIWLLNYLTYRTKNRWHSVDPQFQNGAGSMRLALFPEKAANFTMMNSHNESSCRLPMMRDQKSLTLGGRSFWHRLIHNMLSFNWAWYIMNGIVAAFVPSSCTSTSSIHCSWRIYINISFTIDLKVSANCT